MLSKLKLVRRNLLLDQSAELWAELEKRDHIIDRQERQISEMQAHLGNLQTELEATEAELEESMTLLGNEHFMRYLVETDLTVEIDDAKAGIVQHVIHAKELSVFVRAEEISFSEIGALSLPISNSKLGLNADGIFTVQSVMYHDREGVVYDISDQLIPHIRKYPFAAIQWLKAKTGTQPTFEKPEEVDKVFVIDGLSQTPSLAGHVAATIAPNSPPYDNPYGLPDLVPARPRKRSALFSGNNYYHFNNLAAGLKKRGWDTMTVSLLPPDDPQRLFMHGEDLNLYHPDQEVADGMRRDFLKTIPERFSHFHHSGQYVNSFFIQNFQNTQALEELPWDYIELRRHGVMMGYLPSGCADGGAPDQINNLSQGVCDSCVWQLDDSICNHGKNTRWNDQLVALFDWIGLEGDYQTENRTGRKFVTGPVCTAVDSAAWSTSLTIPDRLKVDREDGQVLIYHSVGNYESRRHSGRDIKGSGALFDAIDALKAEGRNIKLVFANDIPSSEVRFLQCQADIVVDQLNYGRLGANAREALMLGLPLITRLIFDPASDGPEARYVKQAPVADASTASIEQVLRSLIDDKARREDMAEAGRRFAMNWFDLDVCAARYEKICDAMADGTAPSDIDVWPESAPTANPRP